MKFNPISVALRAGVIACSIILLLSSEAICRQQETAEQLIERVTKAIEKEEWDRAQTGIRHALALEPKSPEALFLSAKVYLHEGALSMAIESLNKAIENQPVYPEAHLLLARCLLDSRRTENAREEANTAISQGASSFSAYRLLGEMDSAEAKYEEATAQLETAIRFAQPGDEKEVANLEREIKGLRVSIENLQRFAVLEAEQKSPDVTRPVPLNSPQIRYTEEARAARIQGSVSLEILITETGDVGRVFVLRGLKQGLDEQAIAAAQNMKFSPASKNGTPIPYWMKLVIEFHLK